MKRNFAQALPTVRVDYTCNGNAIGANTRDNADYTLEYAVTDNKITCSIVPKRAITMKRVTLTYDYDFKAGDLFFGNGYQSWTTSKEYTFNDKMLDMIPLAVAEPLKELAGISSDWRFIETPKEPGVIISHCYTYIRNNDELLLIGSLTEKQGFTVIKAEMSKNKLSLIKDVEGVTTDSKYDLFDIYYTVGKYDDVFDAYFKEMGVKKPVIDHLSGYTSWYNYFQKIDEKIILRDLNSLDKLSDSVSIFQIDDGYETYVGDWADPNPAKFPNGMGYISERIHEKGYMSGIWLAPFNVQRTSRTYKEHPDWIIRKNGHPLLGCVGWGGAYTLDIYNEEAREYIKSFFKVVFDDWKYDMVKLDFLYSQCMYPRYNKSRGTIMCEAMEFLRECCGDKLILGCGVPLGAAFGYVDACRISCDVDLVYGGKFYNKLQVNNEIPSAINAITNSIFRRHLDGRVFCSDPDVFFMRYSNLKFTYEQKKLLAFINHLFGNVLFVSDNAAEYNDRDTEIVRKAFAKSDDIKVISCGFEGKDNMAIHFTENGENKTLRFNIKTGNSNINEIF